jgi:hypothetical protein
MNSKMIIILALGFYGAMLFIGISFILSFI